MTTDKATDVTVEPCPFCGGYGSTVSATLAGGISWHMVECNNQECDIGGPPCRSEAEAIAAWNRRTAQAELVSALDNLLDLYTRWRRQFGATQGDIDSEVYVHDARAALSKYRTDGGV